MNRILGAALVTLLSASAATASVVGDALVVRYMDNRISTLYEDIIASTGITTTVLDMPAAGQLAAALAANQYDQVFVLDAPHPHQAGTLFADAADIAALSAWHASHPSIILDGRGLGPAVSGDTNEGNFVRNVVHNFDLNGGGLLFAVDHGPQNTTNANAFLSAMNYDLFHGYDSGFGVGGAASDPLFNTPHTINPSSLWWGLGAPSHWSVSYAPYGLQPNGRVLDQLLWRNEDPANTNLISGHLTPIPEPATLVLLGVTGLFVMRRR